MTERKVISDKEYIDDYVPAGGWLLVQKDLLPEKIGSIFLPEKGRETETKTTGTGTIVKMSPFKEFESAYEAYLHKVYHEGDRVTFSDLTPIISPAPPNVAFSGDCDMKFVTCHITDILGWYGTNLEGRF